MGKTKKVIKGGADGTDGDDEVPFMDAEDELVPVVGQISDFNNVNKENFNSNIELYAKEVAALADTLKIYESNKNIDDTSIIVSINTLISENFGIDADIETIDSLNEVQITNIKKSIDTMIQNQTFNFTEINKNISLLYVKFDIEDKKSFTKSIIYDYLYIVYNAFYLKYLNAIKMYNTLKPQQVAIGTPVGNVEQAKNVGNQL